MIRREYSAQLNINGRRILKIVIDPHYELRHRNSVNDTIILELVALLSDRTFRTKGLYLGVINAYRR